MESLDLLADKIYLHLMYFIKLIPALLGFQQQNIG